MTARGLIATLSAKRGGHSHGKLGRTWPTRPSVQNKLRMLGFTGNLTEAHGTPGWPHGHKPDTQANVSRLAFPATHFFFFGFSGGRPTLGRFMLMTVSILRFSKSLRRCATPSAFARSRSSV